MVTYGPFALYGPLGSLMVPCGPVWFRKVPYGPVCSSMVPYGPVNYLDQKFVDKIFIEPKMFMIQTFFWAKFF